MFEDFRRNAILAKLPEGEMERLRPHLELVRSEIREQVYEPGGPIRVVYFPLAAIFSMVAVAEKRAVVEVATVGREGMIGLPVFLGAASSPHAAFCQIPGPAVRLAADDLRRALVIDGALHAALNRFTQSTMVQIAQNVVCNSTHSAEQRAARWLLTTQDRMGTRFPLTHDFFAQMLGVRRPTVSEVAGRLQAQGFMEYRRGMVEILDRQALEKAACPCYQVVRAEFDELTVGD